MDISDLLKMIPGMNGAQDGVGVDPAALAANPAPQQQPQPQGVGDFLGTPQGAFQGQPPDAQPAPQAPAPAMPDEGSLGMPAAPPDSSGLSGFLSRMVAKANKQDDDTGLSFIDRVGRFGGAITDMAGSTKGAEKAYNDLGEGRVAAAADSEQRAKIAEMADSLGMSPREKLLFLANPKEWAVANAGRLGFHAVAGGDTILEGDPSAGGTVGYAPKYGEANGEGYSATPDGMKDNGGLAVSPQQAAANQLKAEQEASLDRYHKAMAAAATTRANKPAKAGLGNGGDWRAKVVGRGSVQ